MDQGPSPFGSGEVGAQSPAEAFTPPLNSQASVYITEVLSFPPVAEGPAPLDPGALAFGVSRLSSPAADPASCPAPPPSPVPAFRLNPCAVPFVPPAADGGPSPSPSPSPAAVPAAAASSCSSSAGGLSAKAAGKQPMVRPAVLTPQTEDGGSMSSSSDNIRPPTGPRLAVGRSRSFNGFDNSNGNQVSIAYLQRVIREDRGEIRDLHRALEQERERSLRLEAIITAKEEDASQQIRDLRLLAFQLLQQAEVEVQEAEAARDAWAAGYIEQAYLRERDQSLFLQELEVERNWRRAYAAMIARLQNTLQAAGLEAPAPQSPFNLSGMFWEYPVDGAPQEEEEEDDGWDIVAPF